MPARCGPKGGAPVKVIYPADGTTASMEGVGIVKGGPNTEVAKAFVDYINRKDVREMILKATFRRPTRSDVDLTKLPGNMPPMSQVKLDQVRRGRLDRQAHQDARADQGRDPGVAVTQLSFPPLRGVREGEVSRLTWAEGS